MRVSPDSKEAKIAEGNIYNAHINQAYALSSQNGGGYALMDQAQELIKMRPGAPEGHYYAGYAYDLQGDVEHGAAHERRRPRHLAAYAAGVIQFNMLCGRW